MARFRAEGNPRHTPAQVPAVANCNRPAPMHWRTLEEAGIQPGYVGGVAELASALSCYAESREDARDLKGAAALLFDVANRMRRRRAGAPLVMGAAHG